MIINLHKPGQNERNPYFLRIELTCIRHLNSSYLSENACLNSLDLWDYLFIYLFWGGGGCGYKCQINYSKTGFKVKSGCENLLKDRVSLSLDMHQIN